MGSGTGPHNVNQNEALIRQSLLVVKPEAQAATPALAAELYAKLAQESQFKAAVAMSPKSYERSVAALSRLDQLSKRARLAKMLAAVASSRAQMTNGGGLLGGQGRQMMNASHVLDSVHQHQYHPAAGTAPPGTAHF